MMMMMMIVRMCCLEIEHHGIAMRAAPHSHWDLGSSCSTTRLFFAQLEMHLMSAAFDVWFCVISRMCFGSLPCHESIMRLRAQKRQKWTRCRVCPCHRSFISHNKSGENRLRPCRRARHEWSLADSGTRKHTKSHTYSRRYVAWTCNETTKMAPVFIRLRNDWAQAIWELFLNAEQI